MGSISELNARISVCRARIEECQREIEADNRNVEELAILQGRIVALAEQLADAQRGRKAKLFQVSAALDSARRYSRRIVESYDVQMQELLTGSAYTETANGIETADWTVSQEIQRLGYEIESLWSEIQSLNQCICQCQEEIAEIERREREAREAAQRAEREAREAQEAWERSHSH